MIESLHISNYALIDKIDIDFHPGFNIITGETGAGKSIIYQLTSFLVPGMIISVEPGLYFDKDANKFKYHVETILMI